MADIFIQSKIQEVRDQLLLDYADGKYLNNATTNLGLKRPPFGFSDDSWRAIARLIGLNYKQIATKFEQVLAILLGPKKSITTTLSVDAPIGSAELFLSNVDEIPQRGTIILDKGQASEETINYCFVDRTNNRMVLESLTTFAHASGLADFREPLLIDATSMARMNVKDSYKLPVGSTVHVGKYDETGVGLVSSTTTDNDIVLSAVDSLTGTAEGLREDGILSLVSGSMPAGTSYIQLADSSQFPEEGYISVGTPTLHEVESGSTTTVISTAGLSTNHFSGKYIVFIGNVTAGLAQEVVEIDSNTNTTITLTSAASLAPAADDLFYVIDPLDITNTDDTWVDFNLTEEQVDALVGSSVVFVGDSTTALAGEVADLWYRDVLPEIRLTEVLGTPFDASDSAYPVHRLKFIRNDYDTNTLILSESLDFPITDQHKVFNLEPRTIVSSAQVLIQGTGWDIYQTTSRQLDIYIPKVLDDEGNIRTASYLHEAKSDTSWLTTAVISPGDTFFPVDAWDRPDQVVFFTIGAETHIGYTTDISGVAYVFVIDEPMASGYASSTPITIIAPKHAGFGDLPDGNVWTTPNAFAGPYVYDVDYNPYNLANITTLDGVFLAGETHVVQSQSPANSILEVADARYYPLAGFPYSVRVGKGTGNDETLNLNNVNLKDRTRTELTSDTVIGATSIPVVSTVLGSGASFPTEGGYRVKVGLGNEVPALNRAIDLNPGSSNTLVTSNAVEICADDSGNGLDATQTAPIKRPAFIASDPDFNGRPSIAGDGVDDGLSVPSFQPGGGGTDFMVYGVIKMGSTSSTRIFGQSVGSGTGRFAIWNTSSGNDLRFDFSSPGGSYTQKFIPVTPGQILRFAVRFNAADGPDSIPDIYIDGIEDATAYTTTLASNDTEFDDTTHGLGSNETTGAQFFDGKIARIIGYDDAHTAETIQAIDTILARQYTSSSFGTSSDEMLWVTGTSGGNTLLVEETTVAHPLGSTASLVADVLEFSPLRDAHVGVLSVEEKKTTFPVISEDKVATAEKVSILYDDFDVVSATGLGLGDDDVIISFGTGGSKLSAEVPTGAVRGATSIVTGGNSFPQSGYPYIVVVAPGKFIEQSVRVTNNDGTTLTLDALDSLNFTLPSDTLVEYSTGIEEDINYSSISGNTLSFSSPVMLKYNHQGTETILGKNTSSTTPKSTGYDFPLRIPPSLEYRLEILLDLIRAAGITVNIVQSK